MTIFTVDALLLEGELMVRHESHQSCRPSFLRMILSSTVRSYRPAESALRLTN